MNKILTGLTTISLLAMSALPALATYNFQFQGNFGNEAYVGNEVVVVADSGSNSIGNSINKGVFNGGNISSGNNANDIDTGNASAKAKVVNVVNSNLNDNDCCRPEKQVNFGNDAGVENLVHAGAFTGDNGIGNSNNTFVMNGGNISSGNNANDIDTGAAFAEARVANIVNSNIPNGGCCGSEDQNNTFNRAGLSTGIMVQSDTGTNEIGDSSNDKVFNCDGKIGSGNSNNDIDTGDVFASGKTISVVNTNINRSLFVY